MLRKSWILLCLAVAALTACDTALKTGTVTILAPTNGATLTMKDDVANDQDGLQILVKVATTGFDASASATVELDGTAVGSAIALNADGTASLGPVTLAAGSHIVKVVLSQKDFENVSGFISVIADTTPVNGSLEIVAPENNEVFNSKNDVSTDPGFQAYVSLKSTSLVGGKVRVCLKAPPEVTLTGTACKGALGQAIAELPLSTTNLTDAMVTLPEAANLVLGAEHESEDGDLTLATAVTVSVDATAPSCQIVSPLDGTKLSSQSFDVVLKCTGVEEGQPVVLVTSALDEPNNVLSGATDKMTASGDVTIHVASAPLGQQTLTAAVADKALNTWSGSVGINISIVGCDVQLTDPSTGSFAFNIANAAPAGTPAMGTYKIKGRSNTCPNGVARIYKKIGSGSQATIGIANLSSNLFSYDVTFDDGEVGTLTVVVTDGDAAATNNGATLAYVADFTRPTLDSTSPVLGNLYVVNANDPHKSDPGYVVDASNDPGGQANVTLNFTGAGSLGTTGNGTVVISDASKQLASSTYTNNGAQTWTTTISLDEGYMGPVTIVITDAAGNSSTPASWSAKVSTVDLPAALSLIFPEPGTINVFNEVGAGGDRSTYALIQATVKNVASSTPIPTSAKLRLCSDGPHAVGATACHAAGTYEIPGTLVNGNNALAYNWPQVQIPQGAHNLIAEMANILGDVWVDSAPVALAIDTRPPKVLTFVCNEDTSTTKGVLTGAELPVGLPATFNVTFDDIEDGITAELWDGATQVASATTFNNATTFSIGNLGDGLHTFKVKVTDTAGNPNESTEVTPAITNPEAELSLDVQRVAPSILVVAPTASTCSLANDADTNSSTTCELDFVVQVGASAVQVDFSVTNGAGTVSPASVAAAQFTTGNKATARYSLNQTTAPVILTATVFDDVGNSRQVTHTITLVDTIPPSLTIVSPTNDTVVQQTTFAMTVNTDAEAGQIVTVTSSAKNNQSVGSGAVVQSSQNLTFNVTVPAVAMPNPQTLTAVVYDLVGNASAPAVVSIKTLIGGCDVNFDTPSSATPIFNAANAPGGQVQITGHSSCLNQPINFTQSINGAAPVAVTSVTTDGSGNFSFSHTFSEGTTVFTGLSPVLDSSPSSFTAITDITLPQVTISAPVPNGSSQLFVVAKTGNLNVAAGTAGYVADLDNGTAGGQVLFTLNATGVGPSASTGVGKVQILQGSTVKWESTYASNATQAISQTVNLDQSFVGQVKIVAMDYAGNTVTTTWTATVDVIPPGQPVVVTANPGDGEYTRVTNDRTATVEVYFTLPADDGPSGTTTMDFGYSWTNRLALSNPAQALTTDTVYDNATYTAKASVSTSAGGRGRVTLTGVPPLNTYYFQPRLIDSVGNRSTINASPTSLAVGWRTLSLTNLGWGSVASCSAAPCQPFATASADLNGDGYSDLVIANPHVNTNRGVVYVIWGGPGFPNYTPPTENANFISFAGSTISDYVGYTLTIGDINNDTRPDLLINTKRGEVKAYLGVAGATFPVTPNVTFNTTDTSSGFRNVAVIPDVDGDGVKDIALGDTYYVAGCTSSGTCTNTVGTGRVHIVKGQSSWTASTSTTVNVSTANIKTILGPTSSPGARFSWGGSFMGFSAGNETRGSLLIPQFFPYVSGGQTVYPNKVFLIRNDLLSSGGTLDLSSASPSQLLTMPPNGVGAFGKGAALADANKDGKLDLFISDSGAGISGMVYLFPWNNTNGNFDTTPTSFFYSLTIASTGNALAAGDLNSDGSPDLVVGYLDNAAGAATTFFSTPSGLSSSFSGGVTGGSNYGTTTLVMDVWDAAGNKNVKGLLVGDINGNFEIRY